MKNRKQIFALIAGASISLNAMAAEAPEQPLHVLYLGTVTGGGGGGFGARGGGFGSRTNYVYLPGQTLAPDAIYSTIVPTSRTSPRVF